MAFNKCGGEAGHIMLSDEKEMNIVFIFFSNQVGLSVDLIDNPYVYLQL